MTQFYRGMGGKPHYSKAFVILSAAQPKDLHFDIGTPIHTKQGRPSDLRQASPVFKTIINLRPSACA
jgi:hypothetical protein